MSDIEYLRKYLDQNQLDEGICKLKDGIPLQYIVGNTNFYGLNFNVNEHVLIPRFETEGLVEKTINLINDKFNHKVSIAEIGTGSGCIAITLKNKINCEVDAVDISSSALDVAKSNAILNNVDINFYLGNLLEPLNNKYDVIISNPPYIGYDEEVMDLVKNNEPHLALYADNNGLYFYEQILKNIKPYLNDNFIIAFEIGHKQGQYIKEIAHKYLTEIVVDIEKDLCDKDRYVFITR